MSGYKSSLGIGASVTLVDGAFAVDAFRDSYTLDTEGAAASDDLDTINGGKSGKTITIQTTSSARDIVVKNGTGNITLDADITLGETTEHLTLRFNGSGWNLISSGSATTAGSSSGIAGLVQVSDGSGGFSSDAELAYDSGTDTLSVENLDKVSTIEGGTATSSYVRFYGQASQASCGKLELYGVAHATPSAFLLTGQVTSLDQAAGTCTTKGASSNTASTANGDGGIVQLIGGTAAEVGNVDGGEVQVLGGDSAVTAGTGTGGDVLVQGGIGTTTAGNVTIAATRGAVSVGHAAPDASALVDVASTTQGVLLPRMTTGERNAISAPVEGLLIYNLTDNVFNFYNGSAWAAI